MYVHYIILYWFRNYRYRSDIFYSKNSEKSSLSAPNCLEDSANSSSTSFLVVSRKRLRDDQKSDLNEIIEDLDSRLINQNQPVLIQLMTSIILGHPSECWWCSRALRFFPAGLRWSCSAILSYYIFTNINDYTLLKYKLIPRYALLIYCFLRQSNRKGAGIGRYIFLYILKFMNTVKYTLN